MDVDIHTCNMYTVYYIYIYVCVCLPCVICDMFHIFNMYNTHAEVVYNLCHTSSYGTTNNMLLLDAVG